MVVQASSYLISSPDSMYIMTVWATGVFVENFSSISPGSDSAAALLSAPPTGREASPEQLPEHFQLDAILPIKVTLPEDQQGSGREEQRGPPPA